MNLAMIRYVLGWTLGIEGAFMALPCLVALVYGEAAGWWFVPVALGMERYGCTLLSCWHPFR